MDFKHSSFGGTKLKKRKMLNIFKYTIGCQIFHTLFVAIRQLN
jgi:hypothetical protein